VGGWRKQNNNSSVLDTNPETNTAWLMTPCQPRRPPITPPPGAPEQRAQRAPLAAGNQAEGVELDEALQADVLQQRKPKGVHEWLVLHALKVDRQKEQHRDSCRVQQKLRCSMWFQQAALCALPPFIPSLPSGGGGA
jgi:hypothetical protein